MHHHHLFFLTLNVGLKGLKLNLGLRGLVSGHHHGESCTLPYINIVLGQTMVLIEIFIIEKLTFPVSISLPQSA